MSMNFPSPAVPGQVYTPVGGYSYVFLDGVWRIVQDAQSILTADTRNRIVNGAMQISQENGGTGSGVAGYYAADQWSAPHSGLTAVVSTQNVLSTAAPYRNRVRLIVVSGAQASVAAAAFYRLQTLIEGSVVADFRWGTANAKPAVLRFTVFATVAGTFPVAIRDSVGSLSFVAPFTIAVEELNTFVDRVIVIPAPTTGTFTDDTTVSISIAFSLACGTTNQTGTANAWVAGNFVGLTGMTNGLAANNNSLAITNVGLYLDPLATGVPPRWQMPDEAEELRACQRYWYQTAAPSATNWRYGAAGIASSDAGHISWPVTMRTAPANSASVAPTLTNCSALSIVGGVDQATLRVTVTALGTYRALGGTYTFNARM